MQIGGHLARRTNQARPTWLHVHTHHDRFGRRPGTDDGVIAPVDFHLLIDPLGRAAERQFAECDQIPLVKKCWMAC